MPRLQYIVIMFLALLGILIDLLSIDFAFLQWDPDERKKPQLVDESKLHQ